MAASPDGTEPPRKRRKKDKQPGSAASSRQHRSSSDTPAAATRAAAQETRQAAASPKLGKKDKTQKKRSREQADAEQPVTSIAVKPASTSKASRAAADPHASNGAGHDAAIPKKLNAKRKKEHTSAKDGSAPRAKAAPQQQLATGTPGDHKAAAAQPKGKQKPQPVANGVAAAPKQQTVTALPKKGALSSNWQQMKDVVATANAEQQQQAAAKGKRPHHKDSQGKPQLGAPQSLGGSFAVTPVVALDCEMVGVGPGGAQNALARVAVVNSEGNVLLDTFVRPSQFVTDFRTRFSGVRPSDLKTAPPHEEAVERVRGLLEGRILVGHALHNDFKVLGFEHPAEHTRDTSRYRPLMLSHGPGLGQSARSLRVLAKEQLDLSIQSGEHSPVEDARAALYLYLKFRKEWEKALSSGQGKKGQQQQQPGVRRAAKKEKKREKRIQQSIERSVAKGESKGEKRKRDVGGKGAGEGGGKRRRKEAVELAENLNVSGDHMADL